MRTTTLLAAVLLLVSAALTACGDEDASNAHSPASSPAVATVDGGGAMASCAMAVEHDGDLYLADGREFDVTATDQTLDAVVPGCNDTGGTDEADQPTTVQVIEGVDPEVAVWWQGQLMLRQGEKLPNGVKTAGPKTD